jgi:hypothetical protein
MAKYPNCIVSPELLVEVDTIGRAAQRQTCMTAGLRHAHDRLESARSARLEGWMHRSVAHLSRQRRHQDEVWEFDA